VRGTYLPYLTSILLIFFSHTFVWEIFRGLTLDHKALEQAYQYVVIIDMNRFFSDNSYGRDIESFFSKRGLVGLKGEIYCDKKSKRANQQVPLIVDNDTRSLLMERNLPDYDLYNALVTCPGGIEIPTTTLEDYV
jgi:hypothetical protein